MKQKRYTHVFFDLDNTLWDFKRNSYDALQFAFKHFSIDAQNINYNRFFTVYSRNNFRLWEDYRNGAVVKKELIRLRFERTFAELEIDGVDPLEMNEAYLGEMPRQKRLVEGAVELLDYLKRGGYSLYIITNGFREVQIKKLENCGLAKYFSKVFISADIKAPKPRREIFEYAVKSANARKTASLMVGDDREVDIAGALNFGMDAVWFAPETGQRDLEFFENRPGNAAVRFIHALPELQQLL